MRNSAYKLLKYIKNAAAMQAGSFMPPEPLPNSIKAKQIEQQELAAQQGEANAGAGNEQLMQMQKAQEDAVNQLQQSQQQLAQAQAELQNVQAQSQQQQQAMQMQAQQEIQKAQMDAQYELQSEKIKNQQKLLSVQEKYMRAAGKAKPDQNHILSSQLKRVVRKVNSLKAASVNPVPGPRDSLTQKRDTDMQQAEKKFSGLPYSSVLPSQRTQQQWNDISTWKKNYYNNPQVKQNIQQQANTAQTAANKNRPSAFVNEVGNFLDDPYEGFDTFKDNAFGKYDESAGMLGNLKSNPVGSAGRLATNWFGGFVPDLISGGVETAKGIYNLDPTRALKGVGTAGLGVLDAAITYGTGGLGKAMMLPGKALASGAKTVLPAASRSLFQSGVGKGVATLTRSGANVGTIIGAQTLIDTGAEKLGLGNPAANQPSEQDLQDAEDTYMTNYNSGSYGGAGSYPGGVSYPSGVTAPQAQQRWDAGLSPAQRFSILNQAQDQNMYKGASEANKQKYPDIRTFMRNPPPPGEYIPSPIPILQAGFKQHEFEKPPGFGTSPYMNQQGYGPIGDFIKQLIFQVGLPALGIRNPMEPDFARSYANLRNNQAYKLKIPNSF